MPIHYNYVFDNITKTYNFTTKNDILYRVAFVVDETFSSISNEAIKNVYQLVIEKVGESIEPFDSRVSCTIEQMIKKFFNDVSNSVIYVCSSDDNKELLRFKVFERWYLKSPHRVVIEKINRVLQLSLSPNKTHLIYTSLMFHKNNPNKAKLLEIYENMEKVLNEEK